LSPTPDSLVIFGGTLQGERPPFTLDANRGVRPGADHPVPGGGTIDVAAGHTLTYNGVVADNAGGSTSHSGRLTKNRRRHPSPRPGPTPTPVAPQSAVSPSTGGGVLSGWQRCQPRRRPGHPDRRRDHPQRRRPSSRPPPSPQPPTAASRWRRRAPAGDDRRRNRRQHPDLQRRRRGLRFGRGGFSSKGLAPQSGTLVLGGATPTPVAIIINAGVLSVSSDANFGIRR